MKFEPTIREEELKNRVAAQYFTKYDCTRIVGNIDFCVSIKRKDPHQMTFIYEAPILWAEAKNHPTDIYRMLAQLILTIKGEQKGDVEPPRFIGCFDNEKMAFVEYHCILPIFSLNDFNWTQTPSAVDEKTVETVRSVIPQDKVITFRFGADDAELKSFIANNFVSDESPVLATPIDRNNFTFIYQKWRVEVMPYIDAPWDVLKKKYALYDRDFFLAEMNVDDNGTLSVADDQVAVDFYITFNANVRDSYTIRRKNEDELNFNLTFGFKQNGLDAYAAFWRRYKRPPKREYWDFIVSRLDLLVPQDVRERKGSFFTPSIWVEKSQEYLSSVLGENWQDEYYIYDCAGGTGNLEVGLTNKYRVWVSTLDQQDVDVIKERIKNGANLLESHVFRFDFLNDSFDKMPEDLRDVINDPEKRKKLVIYINPPYAEVSSKVSVNGAPKGKRGVNETEVQKKYSDLLGTASRELFAQFLIRISKEIPGCIIGQFSKTKHLQGSAFAKFRQAFHGALEKCFLVPADTFDNVRGKFPIGFFIWRLSDVCFSAEAQRRREAQRDFKSDNSTKLCETPRLCDSALKKELFTSTVADVYDRNGEFIGTKTLEAHSKNQYINAWISLFRQKENNAIGYMDGINGNDFQHNSIVYIINSKSLLPNPRGIWVTEANLIEICIYLAVRHCVTSNWLNDRDNFLVPNNEWIEDREFYLNSLIYTLFSDFNAIKSIFGVNHWIPFTEAEVDAKNCFKSHFMSDILNGRGVPMEVLNEDDLFTIATSNPVNPVNPVKNDFKSAANPLPLNIKDNLSPAARAVLDAGRELWRYYHAQPNANPNASYYDIRAHFQGCKPNGTMNAKSNDATYNSLLATLRTAHKALASEIEIKVYEYGFLKR
jgi:hypothetical protein